MQNTLFEKEARHENEQLSVSTKRSATGNNKKNYLRFPLARKNSNTMQIQIMFVWLACLLTPNNNNNSS
jgi:hypothetical protein